MKRPQYFTVQRCADAATLTFGAPVTIEASGPLEAAERVLGETLSVVGAKSELAGRVLQLGEDYRTTATMVFRSAGAPD